MNSYNTYNTYNSYNSYNPLLDDFSLIYCKIDKVFVTLH